MDPNFGLTDAFAFTLQAAGGSSTDGTALEMAKLKGKTLVVDFWATWCGPCVAQHPMIEDVRQKFATSPDVVILSVDADDDHSLVAPFLEAQKWTQPVYLEGGIAGLMNVSALPTILVIDPTGKLFSRITGFNGGTFESVLSSRIEEARAVTAK
jgi:thiol-disulfide isomerase/thioredoxin